MPGHRSKCTSVWVRPGIVDDLRALYYAEPPMPVAEVAQRLGRKHAISITLRMVDGKRDSLGWPSRRSLSPRRSDAHATAPARPAAGTEVAPAAPTPGGPWEAAGTDQQQATVPALACGNAVPAVPSSHIQPPAGHKGDGCSCPVGYPDMGWRWCDAPRARGAYCATHAARFYAAAQAQKEPA